MPEDHPVLLTDAPVNSQDHPEVHDAVHVGEVQRARHVRGDPGWFVSVCFGTHNGLREGLMQRCVAQSFHLRSVAKPLSLFVETYGIELGSLLADDITYVLIDFDCRPEVEVARDGCVLPSRTRSLHQGESRVLRVGELVFANVVLRHHVPRDQQTHDEGVDCVGTADVFKVVAPPVRWYSVTTAGLSWT